MYKTRLVFSSSGDASEQMCVCIFEIQVLMILRPRSELVNARNGKVETKFYSAQSLQKIDI
jgi:hypothetical protein